VTTRISAAQRCRATPWDFIARWSASRHGIAFHKTQRPAFCDRSADDLIQMLLADYAGGVQRWQPQWRGGSRGDGGYEIDFRARHGPQRPRGGNRRPVHPKIGATDFGYSQAVPDCGWSEPRPAWCRSL
jgi:hypothetical protein